MRVIRSAGQNVSPSDDGRLFDQAFTDGLFEEATITATGGNTITLSALYGIICGRDFTAEAQTISATLPDGDTATGYVYVEFDTSSEDIITIGTALAPFTPTYEDINTNGAVVQMVIAQYEASAVAVTSVTPTYMTATAGSVKAGSIATVEKSPAVANHSIGEFILYGGDLYEVTAAIAAGETLVVGTNIAAASIGDELSALNNGLTQWTVLLSETVLSNGSTATLLDSIENYSEIYIKFKVSDRATTMHMLTADIKNWGYSEQHQYIISTFSSVNVSSSKLTYGFYAQIAFTANNTLKIIEAGSNGYSGDKYFTVYAR